MGAARTPLDPNYQISGRRGGRRSFTSLASDFERDDRRLLRLLALKFERPDDDNGRHCLVTTTSIVAESIGDDSDTVRSTIADELDRRAGRRSFGTRSPSLVGAVGGKKARKARTIFTDKQLQELETMFDQHKYLSVQDRINLAQRMGLTDTQVKTW